MALSSKMPEEPKWVTEFNLLTTEEILRKFEEGARRKELKKRKSLKRK